MSKIGKQYVFVKKKKKYKIFILKLLIQNAKSSLPNTWGGAGVGILQRVAMLAVEFAARAPPVCFAATLPKCWGGRRMRVVEGEVRSLLPWSAF